MRPLPLPPPRGASAISRAFASALAGLSLAAAALCLSARAAEEPVATETLVGRLGDADYAVREQAGEALVRLGFAAAPALAAGTESPDLEIRLRSRQILQRLERSALEKKVSAFLADPASVDAADLPGWAAMTAVTGDARPAREAYVALYRTQPSTLRAVAEGAPAVRSELDHLVRRLQALSMQNRSPDVNDVLGALLLCEYAGAEDSTNRVFMMHSLLSNVLLQQTLRLEPETSPAMRLLRRWVDRDDKEEARHYKLRIALFYGLGEQALALSRKMLDPAANSSIHILPAAMLAVGRYGDESDGAALARSLSQDEVCHTWFNGANQSIKVQVRDVAAAVILHLHGKEPKEFGFEFVQRDEDNVFAIYTLGFENDDDRARTLQRFGEWAESTGGVELPEDFRARLPGPDVAKLPADAVPQPPAEEVPTPPAQGLMPKP